MIRWHSSNNQINLRMGQTINNLSQEVSMKLVLPIFGTNSKVETKYDLANNLDKGEFVDKFVVETPFTRSENSASLSGTIQTESRLPLIYLPEVQGQLVMPSAIGQGFATAAVNTSTLAAVGYGIGFCFNPPLALTYAAVGGGAGLASGCVQAVNVAMNNSFLDFCARGNDFLLTVRRQGMSPAMHTDFDDLCRHAGSKEAKDLARQIVRVCEQEYGNAACAPMRQRANRP